MLKETSTWHQINKTRRVKKERTSAENKGRKNSERTAFQKQYPPPSQKTHCCWVPVPLGKAGPGDVAFKPPPPPPPPHPAVIWRRRRRPADAASGGHGGRRGPRRKRRFLARFRNYALKKRAETSARSKGEGGGIGATEFLQRSQASESSPYIQMNNKS